MTSNNQRMDARPDTSNEGDRDAEVELDGVMPAADVLNDHQVALDKHRSNTVGPQVHSC